MTQHDFEAAVDEMHAVLMHRFPDPVDVFEDQLAQELGLERAPGMSLEEWRRTRVRFIEAADPDPERSAEAGGVDELEE